MTKPALTKEYLNKAQEAFALGETNDCSARAVAITCGVEYLEAHKVCEATGRKKGKGLSISSVLSAVRLLGLSWRPVLMGGKISQYPGIHNTLKHVTSAHPRKFNKVWKDGKSYLFFYKGHVSAVVDGMQHDWSARRYLHTIKIVEVYKEAV